MKFDELRIRLAAMTRKEANALADRAGVPRPTIAHIRKGRTANPQVDTVERLAEAISASRPSKRIKAEQAQSL